MQDENLAERQQLNVDGAKPVALRAEYSFYYLIRKF